MHLPTPKALFTCALLAACAATTHAAEEADPAMAVLKRMREQLRTYSES